MPDELERPGKYAVISGCRLLEPLAEEEKKELATGAIMSIAGKGETLFYAGEPASFIGIVGTGFLKMTKTSIGGQEVAVELLGPGQCFGLLAAIEGRTYPLSAVAVTQCWYMKIPTHVFASVYTSQHALKDQVIRSIAPRLRKAHDMMGRLTSSRVEERVAVILLVLAESYGRQTSEGVRLEVPLTRQDISELAGTTVETAIRIISRWQKEGLISTEKHFLTLHDPDALFGRA